MKKLFFFLAISAGLLFISCSKDLDCRILIRVYNQSAKPVSDVIVFSQSSNGGNETATMYGSVSPGNTTAYKHHQKALDWPILTFTMQGYPSIDRTDPRCLMGISDLEPGKYSILIWDDNLQVYFRLVKDE